MQGIGDIGQQVRYGVLLSWKRQTLPKKPHTNKCRTAAVTGKVPRGGGDRTAGAG